MDQEMMNKNARDLFALSKECGPERVKIPSNMSEGMEFIRKWSMKKNGEFNFDDPQVVNKVRELADKHSTVFIIVNSNNLKTELYVT